MIALLLAVSLFKIVQVELQVADTLIMTKENQRRHRIYWPGYYFCFLLLMSVYHGMK